MEVGFERYGLTLYSDRQFYRAADVDALLASMAAGPWRYDVDSRIRGKEYLVAVRDGGEIEMVVGPITDIDLAVVDIIAYAELNPPEGPV